MHSRTHLSSPPRHVPERIAMEKRHHNSASRNSAPPKSSRPKLLQTRRDSAYQLGVSVWQVIELEKRGALTSVRLTNSPSARSYNIVAEVEALARGEKLQHSAVGRDASAAASNSAEQSSTRKAMK
jgi:hypothetical protein